MLEVLKFYAPWCTPCHVIEPIIEQLEKEYQGKTLFQRINVDQEADKTLKYGVLSIPTLVIVKDGQEVDRLIGVTSKETLKSKIDSHLS